MEMKKSLSDLIIQERYEKDDVTDKMNNRTEKGYMNIKKMTDLAGGRTR